MHPELVLSEMGFPILGHRVSQDTPRIPAVRGCPGHLCPRTSLSCPRIARVLSVGGVQGDPGQTRCKSHFTRHTHGLHSRHPHTKSPMHNSPDRPSENAMAPPPRAANHDRRAGTWAERGATRREILGADGAVHARFTATAWASTDGRGAEKEQILPGEAGGREAVRGRRLEVEGAGAMTGSQAGGGARDLSSTSRAPSPRGSCQSSGRVCARRPHLRSPRDRRHVERGSGSGD